MTLQEQNEAARQFINRWKKRGYEKGDTQSFWIELLHGVLGFDNVTQRLQFEKQVEIGEKDTNYIDVYIPETKVIIEQKSLKIDLDKKQPLHNNKTPYEQAFEYNTHLTADQKANWIITSNFREIRIYDMNKSERERKPIIYTLDELQTKYSAFEFLFNKEVKTISKEMEVSMQAGELVGKLYDELYKNYVKPNEETLKSLNILCVRLVFCMYAEDAGLFGRKNMFHDYLMDYQPKKMRKALIDLFRILDTPENERDADEDEDLLQFPYVNGGLFSKEEILIPQFTEELKYILLEKASKDFDWSKISPTIFGAIFESTLNPETRRSGGMHYTSIENIHKVIDPLFLCDLTTELEDILKSSNVGGKRTKALKNFQNKIASLKFLDPAAGSGNFLTETYTSLRKLENRVLRELNKEQTEGQMTLNISGVAEEMLSIKVSIQQFYGIEINDFAVTVAKTALWIAEAQMMQETLSFANINADFLPLKSYVNIIESNALRIDWENILSARKCNYIMGNPPFIGYALQNQKQKEEIKELYSNNGKTIKYSGKIDYVSCWYMKAASYIYNTQIKVAFVSTNSITQGEQVANVWEPILERYKIHIDFAYPTFIWESEASQKAHVYCVIIGFSFKENSNKRRIIYENSICETDNINFYLTSAPTIFIHNKKEPLCDVPIMMSGGKPVENGQYIFTEQDKEEFIKKEPNSSKFFKRYIGSDDFINGYKRYCLWLHNENPSEYRKLPTVMQRIENVKNYRLKSKKAATRVCADRPYEFMEIKQPRGKVLIIPEVSGERRRYIPIDFFEHDCICSNKVRYIQEASLYHFGILTSNVHMAWVRVVAGRLGSSYSYSINVVYNNFPWPSPTPEQKKRIEETAQKILDARALYPNSSLADLYDPLTMPIELQKAHTQNDIAVMQAYGFNIKEMTEADCVAELMKMYQDIVVSL